MKQIKNNFVIYKAIALPLKAGRDGKNTFINFEALDIANYLDSPRQRAQ